MNALWQLIAGFIARLIGWLKLVIRNVDVGEDVDVIAGRIEAYREAASELVVAKGELRAYPEKTRSVQAALCLGVATVERVLADALALLVVGGVAVARRDCADRRRRSGAVSTVRRRAALTDELYDGVFRLVEQARIEMVGTGKPHPVDPDEFISAGLLSEPPADLQVIAQRLEETFEVEVALAVPDRGALSQLLARLRSQSGIASDLTANQYHAGTASQQRDRSWIAELYRRVFRLWVLISEELVCPGVTEALSNGGEPDLQDVFLMTDPVARARYEREGRLEELEADIRCEVMRGRPWEPADREYVDEVARLQSVGALRRTASFWNISPHPPVFKATRNGRLSIDGHRYRFRRGQEIVWACPMIRDRTGIDGPVLIDNFNSRRIARLCGEMPNAMRGDGRRSIRSSTQPKEARNEQYR